MAEMLGSEAHELGSEVIAANIRRRDEEIFNMWTRIHDQVIAVSGVSGCSFPTPWGPSGKIIIQIDSTTQPNALSEIQQEIDAICGTLMSYMTFEYNSLGRADADDPETATLPMKAA